MHQVMLRMLPLLIAISGALVLELGLGDRLQLDLTRPLVSPAGHPLFQ